MQMTDGEVVMNVMQAKDQRSQITICADLNCCSEEKIKDILKANDIDLRTLRGAAHKRVAETKQHKPHKKPYKKPEIIPAPPANAEKKSALTELNERIELLMKEKAGIDDEINDLRSRLTAMIDKLAGGSNNESTQT